MNRLPSKGWLYFTSSWVLGLILLLQQGTEGNGEVLTISWDSFGSVQQGEWMLEFYAPWCPACKQFTSTWEAFASGMAGKDVHVGKVDVTVETMLSGRFMVTHLPSIFHIKDGEVRYYTGERGLTDLNNYVDDEKWRGDSPISLWRSPTAPHMHLVGTVFWLSERAREFQVMLEQEYHLPTYAIFILIALATIVVGLVLGGVMVCSIELCLRCCSRGEQKRVARHKHPTGDKKAQDPPPTGPSENVVEVGTAGKTTEGGGARKRKGGDK